MTHPLLALKVRCACSHLHFIPAKTSGWLFFPLFRLSTVLLRRAHVTVCKSSKDLICKVSELKWLVCCSIIVLIIYNSDKMDSIIVLGTFNSYKMDRNGGKIPSDGECIYYFLLNFSDDKKWTESHDCFTLKSLSLKSCFSFHVLPHALHSPASWQAGQRSAAQRQSEGRESTVVLTSKSMQSSMPIQRSLFALITKLKKDWKQIWTYDWSVTSIFSCSACFFSFFLFLSFLSHLLPHSCVLL